MEIVVNNFFGNVLINLFKDLINGFINFWNVINKTWFTIPLSDLNDILKALKIDFTLEDLPINFLYFVSAGLVIILLIHIIKLIIS